MSVIERACIAIAANEMREQGMSEDGVGTIMAQPEAKAGAVETYSSTVRAALQAIREPDADTIEAGWADAHEEDPRATFTAMIDHILNEGEGK